jgi:hypothetical protein
MDPVDFFVIVASPISMVPGLEIRWHAMRKVAAGVRARRAVGVGKEG